MRAVGQKNLRCSNNCFLKFAERTSDCRFSCNAPWPRRPRPRERPGRRWVRTENQRVWGELWSVLIVSSQSHFCYILPLWVSFYDRVFPVDVSCSNEYWYRLLEITPRMRDHATFPQSFVSSLFSSNAIPWKLSNEKSSVVVVKM